jgi:hypothetical protein
VYLLVFLESYPVLAAGSHTTSRPSRNSGECHSVLSAGALFFVVYIYIATAGFFLFFVYNHKSNKNRGVELSSLPPWHPK